MEGHGSGGSVTYEPRLSRLEAGYEAQADELRHLGQQVSGVKTDIAAVASAQSQMVNTLRDIGEKLDQTRTRRPDMQAVIAGLSLLIVIASLALTPLYIQQNRNLARVNEIVEENKIRGQIDSEILGRYASDRESVLWRLERLENFKDATLVSRYTKDDGRKLEDKVDEHVTHEIRDHEIRDQK